MSRYSPAARPLAQCLRSCRADAAGNISVLALRPASASPTAASTSTTTTPTSLSTYLRSFSSSARQLQQGGPTPDQPIDSESFKAALEGWELDPNQTTLPWAEKELMRRGTPPVGTRRRRAAIRGTSGIMGESGPIPFELMPYQCFQEARKILQADRDQKLQKIAQETAKIQKLEAVGAGEMANTSRGGEAYRVKRLASLRQHVEELKVLADINDPQVKRRFEDGLGDMNKPIYRYMAEKRWRGRPLRLIKQRIEQFRLAPDLLAPSQLMDPTADIELFFRSYRVPSGAIIDSLISEVTPRLRVQVFDRGTRYVSVAVVDADVPDLENDTYTTRCHYLATNIPLAPTDSSLPLSHLDSESQVVLPWLPAFAQKGSKPHRLAVIVFQQQPPKSAEKGAGAGAGAPADEEALAATRLDIASLKNKYTPTAEGRAGFNVRGFVATHRLNPIGCTLFRTEWDAGTESVMERLGVPGADQELKAVRLRSLKPPRKARGWEAKHQGPKYRHLWKYTHRIASPKRKFVR